MLTLTRTWGRFLDWTTVLTTVVVPGVITAIFAGVVRAMMARHKAQMERVELDHKQGREDRSDQVTVLHDVVEGLRVEVEGLKKRVDVKDTMIGRLRDTLTSAKVDLKEATMLAQSCAVEVKVGREAHERCEKELAELKARVVELESRTG